MECDRLRAALDLAPSPDSADPLFTEALAHARLCPPCSARLSRRLDLDEKIRGALLAVEPPQTLDTFALAGVPARRSARIRKLSAIAAMAFLTVGVAATSGSFYLSRQTEKTPLEKVLAMSLVNHRLHETPELATPDPTEASRWLTQKLGAAAPLPASVKLPPLAGARRCAFGEKAVGVVQFNIANHRNSMFIFDAGEFGVSGAQEGPRRMDEYAVSVWSEGDTGYSLVSDGISGPAAQLVSLRE